MESTKDMNWFAAAKSPSLFFTKADDMANTLTKAYMQKHKTLYDNEKKQELIKQYNRSLIDMGYGVTRSALKKENLVDIRAAFIASNEPTDMLSTMLPELINDFGVWCQSTDLFYATIPCFTNGVIQVNKNRYIYWELKDVNITDKTMSLYLMDYMACDGYWQPGVSGTIDTKGLITSNHETRMDMKTGRDELLFSKIYRIVPYAVLQWTKSDIQLWEEVVIPFARLTEDEMAKNETNNLCELCRYFTYYTIALNYFLNKEKPKAQRRSVKTHCNTDVVSSDVIEDKRVVRNVGMISVKSEKPPKASTEKTVMKYKVASWRTRGHVRHLKSGKQIYIKESVHKRKCLNREVEADPKTTIKLKG